MKCQASLAHEEPGLACSCCHCHPLTVEVAATAGEALMQLQLVRQRALLHMHMGIMRFGRGLSATCPPAPCSWRRCESC